MGRRFAFTYGTIVLLVGVALQAGGQDFAMLVVGRIVAGIGTAVIGTNLAAYQAEVSHPRLRGRIVSFVQLSYQVGVLIAYVVGLGTVKIPGNNSWRVATALQIVPGIVLIIASFTIPKSPRWIIERHPDQAARALKELARVRRLPQNHDDVKHEYAELVTIASKMKTHRPGRIPCAAIPYGSASRMGCPPWPSVSFPALVL